MARNIRWTIPFVSLGGVSCHIDVYDNDWPSGSVTEISKNNVSTPGWAADDPFYYEENDSEDLLDVIRTKSGYIRLIENNYGDLNALFPQTNMDRYVRVFYGETLVFTGYIKAESYGLNWGDYHREISLPVISPLSLADGMWFTPPTNPEFRTLSWWMYDVINGLDPNIKKVEFPDADMSRIPCIMSLYLCSLAICPQDVEWNSLQTTAVEFYSGKSFKYFLEGFCNAYGLIVHDEPEKLVFSRFDYTGIYSYKEKSTFKYSPTVRHGISDSNVVEALNVDISNDDNEEYTVLPLSKITVDGDGEFFSSAELPTDVSKRSTNGGIYNQKYYGCYYPLNDILSAGNEGFPLLYGPYLAATGRLSQQGVMIAYDGSDRVLMQKGAGGTGVPRLIYFRLYNMRKTSSGVVLRFNGAYGENIESLNRPGTTPTIHVFVKNGNRYYVSGTGWSTTEDGNNMSFNEKQQLVIPIPLFLNEPLEIWMTSDLQYWSENYIYVIDNIEVSIRTSTIGEWYVGHQEAKKVINGSPSDSEGSVSRVFSRQWKNSNYLSTDAASDSQLVSEPSEPTYPYLTTSQKRLQLHVKGTLPDDHYMKRLLFAGNLWRLIAKAFHPWNDEYKLTLHTDDDGFFYFYLLPVNSSTFTFTRAAGATGDLYYSTDKENWTQVTSGTATELFYAGVKVYWRGNLTPGQNGVGTFSSSEFFNVGGDVMSLFGMNNFAIAMADSACKNLLSGSKVIDASELYLPTTLTAHCYESMFSGCTRLTTLPRLNATTLADSCYASMFSGCILLTGTPALPATTLVASCYASMFQGCTSITNAPELPATTLATSCYASMFSGCTSLTDSPDLPASTLVASCYASMFSGCTSLIYVKCLATNISAANCTNNWLYNVAEEGTFTKAASMQSWPTGASGIPSGWDVADDNE